MFSLGKIVATPGALSALTEQGITPLSLLVRHVRGDWGDLGADDKRANIAAIKEGNPAKDRTSSFYLSDEQITDLRDEYKTSKQLPIPYNSGAYRAFLLALVSLGVNKSHSFKAVKDTIKDLMSAPDTKVDGKTQWQRYTGKEAATDNEETALNIDGKLQQNAEVLQRLGGNTPYGMKLLQIGKVIKSKGVVVDIIKGKDGKEKLYRLNTDSAAPVNQFRNRRASK